MALVLLLAGSTQTVVVERGGTSWWVPFLSALGVAIFAALASYVATWRLKRADVNREHAIRAADLVDEAERITGWRDQFNAHPDRGASDTMRLLQQARVRVQPIDDAELQERLHVAIIFNHEFQTWHQPTGRHTHWLNEAIANVRQGLVPHLSASAFFFKTRDELARTFPTLAEYEAMPKRDPEELLDALIRWRAPGVG